MKKLYYVILITHGSTNLNWKFLLTKLKTHLKTHLFKLYKLYVSFIIKEKPYVISLINKCMKQNIRNILFIPIFLGKGKHLIIDLYKLIKNICYIYNDIRIFFINCINKFNNIFKLLIKIYIKNIKLLKSILIK